jgi:3-hydroxyisobutyrate dehydrogenase-like beta-hydroxyacid dehydrogenase
MDIGFIGLGQMGAGMAANLVKAGRDVTVYNRTRAKAEALVAQGAKAGFLAASVYLLKQDVRRASLSARHR